jgi:hypothetical protein
MSAPQTDPITPAPADAAGKALTPARPVSPEVAAAKARRDIVKEIKGTLWGKDCTPEVAHAVARWSLDMGVDAVRHVELLGGKPYLNGDFYLEKAAPFVLSGEIRYEEPRFVHADPGLIQMANRKLEEVPEWEREQVTWAREELFFRFQERANRGVPHDATGACVFVVHTKSGTPIVGVNWCGGESKAKKKANGERYRGDPIGDAEPTKTAQTRAARRALRQIIEAFPDSGIAKSVAKIEASIRTLAKETEAVVKTEDEVRVAAGAEQRRLASAGIMGGATYADPEPVEAPAPAPIDEAERLAAVARDAALEEKAEEARREHEEDTARTAEDEAFELRLAAEGQ